MQRREGLTGRSAKHDQRDMRADRVFSEIPEAAARLLRSGMSMRMSICMGLKALQTQCFVKYNNYV